MGVIHNDVLAGGADTGTHVDISTAYLRAAGQEAERLGHADRRVERHGDFVEIADDLEAADWVTLDRVVCCYPDPDALLRAAASRTHRALALSFPRRRLITRIASKLQHAAFGLVGNGFRFFAHDPAEIRSALEDAGMKVQFSEGKGSWQVEVYVRASSAAAGSAYYG